MGLRPPDSIHQQPRPRLLLQPAPQFLQQPTALPLQGLQSLQTLANRRRTLLPPEIQQRNGLLCPRKSLMRTDH